MLTVVVIGFLSISHWLPEALHHGGCGELQNVHPLCPHSLEFPPQVSGVFCCPLELAVWRVKCCALKFGRKWFTMSWVHNPRATCVKLGTAASLADNILAF